MARQGADVCSVSLGACVACFDNTTVTGRVPPDTCFMVSPSCIVVTVICSVLTYHLCLWLVSILRFFFPVVCVSSIEHLLNLVIGPTSGTCRTAVLTTPLKVVEAPRTSIRQDSLRSSFSVRTELTVLHNAPAWAQESATRIPKWKDLGPLRLPCPWTDEPMATCAVQVVWRGTNEATIPAGGRFEC